MRSADPLDTAGGDEPGDERVARAYVRALDAEADALDTDTTARLARIRRQALARRADTSPFAVVERHRFAIGGLAMAASLALVIGSLLPGADAPPAPSVVVDGPAALGDLPVLSGTEDLEFYDSIDFLLWLEQRRA